MSDDNSDLEKFFEIKPSKSTTPKPSEPPATPGEPRESTSQVEQIARQIGGQVSHLVPSSWGKSADTDLPSDEITYSPSRTNNYQTTRLLSSLFKVLAWVLLVLAILSALFAITAYQGSYNYYSGNSLGLEFFFAVFSVFLNISMSATFALLSEGINVILDTEANTRQTAKTLEHLLRSQASL